MAYFDAAQDRLEDESRARFETMLEAVRAGTVFAHDSRQYRSWRARRPTAHRGATQGLTGDALEAAVRQIADLFPGHVVTGAA